MKGTNRLQLERTDFDRQHIELATLAGHLRKRLSNISTRDRPLTASNQHLGKQLGSRGLPVSPGYRNNGQLARTPAELEFSDDLDAARVKVPRQWRLRIDA